MKKVKRFSLDDICYLLEALAKNDDIDKEEMFEVTSKLWDRYKYQ